ncbi:MAG: ATP phosphoribosyltransferase [Candidatus Micrarchaeota archaeon]|nr:ATP phosphoribosyltransferase [Candidatus Micrarchaeota archaeon]
MENGKIRIAIPNKGVLCQPALEMLKKAGFAALDSPQDTLCARCEDERVEYLFVRAQDVPRYVDSGAACAGITGSDMLEETGSSARRVLDLGFGRCEIALAVPEASEIKSVESLEGKRIATKLPATARKYLKMSGVKAEILELSGATEIAPAASLAEAVIDHVQTGRTLRANRLRKVATISESSAFLVMSGKKCLESEEEIVQELCLLLEGVNKAKRLKYLVLNAPSDKALQKILRVLPSMESPTLMRLAKEGEWAVQTVIEARQLPSVVRKVKLAGGKDMLVMPLEKVIL